MTEPDRPSSEAEPVLEVVEKEGPEVDVPTVDGNSEALVDTRDDELLDAIRRGSRSAAWELFCRHGGVVYTLARLLAPDEEAAQAVVEDVFVALQQSHGRLEDPIGNVRLGLLAMGRRRALAAQPRRPLANPPSRHLPSEDGQALGLMILAEASRSDVALVLAADRRAAIN